MAVGGWWGRGHPSARREDLWLPPEGSNAPVDGPVGSLAAPCNPYSITSMGRPPVHRADPAGGHNARAHDDKALVAQRIRQIRTSQLLGSCLRARNGRRQARRPGRVQTQSLLEGPPVVGVPSHGRGAPPAPTSQERHRDAGVTRSVRRSGGGAATPAARRASRARRPSPCAGWLPQAGAPGHGGRVRSPLHGGRKRKVTLHPGRMSVAGAPLGWTVAPAVVAPREPTAGCGCVLPSCHCVLKRLVAKRTNKQLRESEITGLPPQPQPPPTGRAPRSHRGKVTRPRTGGPSAVPR